MAKIVLGYAPTRRSIFSAPDAVKYADLTRAKLRSMGVAFVDIDDISEDGLLHDDADRIRIAEKFRERNVDGLFFPHGNFGTEYEVARLAKELNVPVLCLSQLSRANESRQDKRPMLSDLRESGAIEQDADIVLFLYREGYYNKDAENPNLAECIIAKNRHGETGTIELQWTPEFTTFTDMEWRREEY